jgi:hypothetical protein
MNYECVFDVVQGQWFEWWLRWSDVVIPIYLSPTMMAVATLAPFHSIFDHSYDCI